jgi:predicted TIM-barrel fold metal-dependent hydrolase
MKLLLVTVGVTGLALAQQPPIFDVHLHADSPANWPLTKIKACPGDKAKTWPAFDPRSTTTKPDDIEDCPNPVYSLETEQAVIAETKRLILKYNIRGSVSGSEELVAKYKKELGERMVPAIYIEKPGHPPVERIRELINSKQIRVIGEVAIQYEGVSPDDPSFEPYWALAEELDIPVGIHIGPGPAGGPHVWKQKDYRVRLTDPALLEPVLNRHPKLRVYVMHAGWPMADRMIHMLYTYPQLYVDTGVIDWYIPRKEFHRYLQRLVDAGFGSRIMFGSDQMIWPQMIEVAVESIRTAPFLTEKQKRDIFFNNAARFFGLAAPSATK